MSPFLLSFSENLHGLKKHSEEEQLERREILQLREIRSAYLLLCACVRIHTRLHFLYGCVCVCAHAHDKILRGNV